jgi:cell division protein FtsB
VKHDHLTLDELVHYGCNGEVEGLDADIAARFEGAIVEAKEYEKVAQKVTDLEEQVHYLTEALEDIEGTAREATS